eukprot:5554351-Amphidinium_carterae.1
MCVDGDCNAEPPSDLAGFSLERDTKSSKSSSREVGRSLEKRDFCQLVHIAASAVRVCPRVSACVRVS